MKITYILLFIIVIAFIAQLVVPGFEKAFILNPNNLLPWMIVTSIFLHGGILHLFFNGYALIAFGPYLENTVGKRDFLILFFLAGIVGSISYLTAIYFGIIPNIPALGASGAIYGILGALSVLIPELTLLFFLFPVSIRTMTVIWFILEILGTFNPDSGIASVAHLGGLITGLAFGYYYKSKVTKMNDWVYKQYAD